MRFKDVHAGGMVSLSTIRPCFTNLKSDFLILLEDADADLLNSIPRSFGSIAKSIPNR
jgi:hypothetical protein